MSDFAVHQRTIEMVDELCSKDSGLTAWECDFIDDMSKLDGRFTEKQLAKIEQIWDRVMD